MTEKKFDYYDLILLLFGFIIGYLGIVAITEIISFIGHLTWGGIPIKWPDVLFDGGKIGGVLAGMIILLEKYYLYENKISFEEIDYKTNFLYYLTFIIVVGYFLELLVENMITQILIYLTFIGFVIILVHDALKWTAVNFIEDNQNQREIFLTKHENQKEEYKNN